VQVGELLIDLGELGHRTLVERAADMAVTAGLQQLGDLVEGEPEPLRGIDDPSRATVSGG
jgi:hypothetical protein